ncbi:hypothetical protein IEC97_11235 [Neobacillus cucumis]|uniref:CBO0543 family protein n=1 Tax=Neobacillus cucumis TaxID=1740721 RepID=UPI0018DF1219|nr:CBO0543 family protein [Neobacillus cucumis]MBI0577931.1 hypothetical protein [Neobacillus cucumis]
MSFTIMFMGTTFFILVTLVLFITAWRIGDWRNWRKYYSTLQYLLIVVFLVNILTHNHRLWFFHKTLIIPNHTLIDLAIAFTNLIPIALLYLSRYPDKASLIRRLAYITFWVVVCTLIETMFLFLKEITYHYGWNFGWSVVTWILIFIGLRLHYTKPLCAWMLLITSVIFLIVYFKIPITQLQ